LSGLSDDPLGVVAGGGSVRCWQACTRVSAGNTAVSPQP
jgi:hypothetical protein